MARRFGVCARLRSRRLAVLLILGITVYAFLATLVPGGGPTDPDFIAWRSDHPRLASVLERTGLDEPFVHPLFLATSVLLTASTIACAWERTTRALAARRSRGVVSEALAERLRRRPAAMLPIRASGDARSAMQLAERRLRKARARVRRGPVLIEADANGVGLFGSPIFHWSLALLFVVTGLGQATRSEGAMVLREGVAKPDAHEAYYGVNDSPLFFDRHTGLQLVNLGIVPDLKAGGVERGAAADIALLDDAGREVARRMVYPNSPLKYRSLTIHRYKDGAGPLLVADLVSAEGTEVIEIPFLADETMPLGLAPQQIILSTRDGARYDVRMTVRRGRKVSIAAREVGSASFRELGTAEAGDLVSLPGGYGFRPAQFGTYFGVIVVNDWSIQYIYLLFVVASLGITLSVFFPPRRVWVMLVDDAAGKRLHVDIESRKSDPSFRTRVLASLRRALDAAELLAPSREGELEGSEEDT